MAVEDIQDASAFLQHFRPEVGAREGSSSYNLIGSGGKGKAGKSEQRLCMQDQ